MPQPVKLEYYGGPQDGLVRSAWCGVHRGKLVARRFGGNWYVSKEPYDGTQTRVALMFQRDEPEK